MLHHSLLVTSSYYFPNLQIFYSMESTPWSSITSQTYSPQTSRFQIKALMGRTPRLKATFLEFIVATSPSFIYVIERVLTRSSFQRQLPLPNGSAILHIASSTVLILPQQFPPSLATKLSKEFIYNDNEVSTTHCFFFPQTGPNCRKKMLHKINIAGRKINQGKRTKTVTTLKMETGQKINAFVLIRITLQLVWKKIN